MKALLFSASLLAVVPPVFSATTNFDSDTVGQLPAGWTCSKTGKGSPRWTVEAGVWTKADSVTELDDFNYADIADK